ncbi:MAG: response regulator, partial [Acidobacteriota bacterium]|nr:response regulator [Acidobacteriota bacterium]
MAVDGKRIRVLIVDDSAFMRKVLQSIISADPTLEVCGEARDGKDAVDKTEQLNPDVVTMDINMPHVDGLQATEIIMSKQPKPIVIVSSESRDGADITLKALELGAIDFVAKPSSGIDLDMNSVREELVRKLKMAAKVRVVRTAVRSKLGTEIASSAPRTEPAPPRIAAKAPSA